MIDLDEFGNGTKLAKTKIKRFEADLFLSLQVDGKTGEQGGESRKKQKNEMRVHNVYCLGAR